MIQIKEDNILNSNEKYIIHQCNCNAKGLAKSLFDKYLYANVYKNRTIHSKPGTISVKGNGKECRYIINAFGQYTPGKPNIKETKLQRLIWFKQCLDEIKKIENVESIAFPYKMGCGYGGGNWNEYLKTIEQFSEDTLIKVII